MTKASFALLRDFCEQRGEKRSELAVESFYPQANTGFQTTQYLGN